MSVVALKADGRFDIVALKTGGGDDGGGTGGGGNVSDRPGLDGQLVGPVLPQGRFVALDYALVSVTEGESFVLTARLSQAMLAIGVMPLKIRADSTALPGTYSFDPRGLVFAPGSLTAATTLTTTVDAGGDNGRSLIVELDPTGDIIDDPQGVQFVLDTRPGIDNDTCRFSIQDNTAPNEVTWVFGGGANEVSFSEAVGDVVFSVVLDGPTTEPVSVQVDLVPATALENRDFEPFSELITFAPGSTREEFTLSFFVNGIDTPMDLICFLQGSLVSGPALTGAIDQIEITLEDTDSSGGGGIPFLEWSTQSQSLLEGRQLTCTAILRSSTGEPRSFGQREVLPLGISYNGATQADFTIDYGSGEGNSITFEPGASSSSFTVTATDDAEFDPGEVITFTVLADSLSIRRYDVGDRDVLSVTVAEGGGEPTELLIPEAPGISRRLVQGLAAVVPPVPPTQLGGYSLALSTGERVQVVEMNINGGGLVNSAYWYGFAPGAESMPGEPNSLLLRIPEAGDVDPPEAGQFTDHPPIIFSVRYSRVFEEFTCATNGPGLKKTFTGEDGLKQQTGPEIVREKSYTLRPIKPSSTASYLTATSESEDACGLFDFCVTEIAGDPDVYLVQGRFLNGNWRSTDDMNAESEMCDGEINLRHMRVGSSGSWTCDFVYPHPQQSQTPGQIVDILRDRGDDYFFQPCARMGFYFAIYRTGNAAAKARAEHYMKLRHIAWAVGDLGPTRNPIWGMNQVLQLDHNRAGTDHVSTADRGFQVIKTMGELFETGSSSEAGPIGWWRAGENIPGGQYFQGRLGWWQGMFGSGGGDGAQSGRFAHQALVPYGAGWLRGRFVHEYMLMRTALAARSVGNDLPGWWWDIARQEGGQWINPVQGSIGSAPHRRKLYVFNEPRLDTDAEFKLAPTTRSWNEPDANRQDPDEGLIYSYKAPYHSHISMIRGGLEDAWYGTRGYNSIRDWEEVCASMSRALSPIDSPVTFFDSDLGNYAAIKRNMTPRAYQTGVLFGQDPQRPNDPNAKAVRSWENPRQMAWTATFLGGFYGVTNGTNRLAMRGLGVADGKGSPETAGDMLGMAWDLAEYLTQPTGMWTRTISNNLGPNPYSVDTFGPTDFSARTGALPRPDLFPDDQATVFQLFHFGYMLNGLYALRQNVFGLPDAAGRPANNNRIWQAHSRYVTGAKVYNPGGGRNLVPYVFVPSFGPNPMGDAESDVLPDVMSIQEMEQGDSFWISERLPGQGDPPLFGYVYHKFKVSWFVYFACNVLKDDSFLNDIRDIYELQGASDQELVEFFVSSSSALGSESISSALTSSAGGSRWDGWQNYTYNIPLVAYLLNRYS